MNLQRLPAVFMRGGTSNGLVFRRDDLPGDQAEWAPLFLAALGSPDRYGRQLDGMGGGASSLSKVCVVGRSDRADADVDYTFAQVSVTEPQVDFAATCGNMAATVGPFAVDEGFVDRPPNGSTVVRIFHTNSGRIIHSHFAVRDGVAVPDGDCAIDGVPGTSAPIRLEFLDPGGAATGAVLPTGHPVDQLLLGPVGDAAPTTVAATMIDAGIPSVFVRAEAFGLTGAEMPIELERDHDVLAALEHLRQVASVAMGLTKDLAEAATVQSIPKVGLVSAPRAFTSLDGREFAESDLDLTVRTISMATPHRAIPVTAGIALAVATRMPGTIVRQLCQGRSDVVRLGHPSGVFEVDAEFDVADFRTTVRSATILRTTRRLFEGNVVLGSVRT